MDLMIDLETLGNDTNATVVSIGAVFFDINKKILGPEFYGVLELDSQFKRGRIPNESTIKWWMDQSKDAQKVFKTKGASVEKVLNAFTNYYKQHPKAKVWGNGSSFDISIMEGLYYDFGVKCPWDFWNVMDLRTFKRFVAGGAKVTKSGTNHNALCDAISQAKYIISHVK